jgi:hypothetical protein
MRELSSGFGHFGHGGMAELDSTAHVTRHAHARSGLGHFDLHASGGQWGAAAGAGAGAGPGRTPRLHLDSEHTPDSES